VVAVDRRSDDPRLPYRLGTEAELTAVVDRAQAAAGSPGRVRPLVADAAVADELAAAVDLAVSAYGGLDARRRPGLVTRPLDEARPGPYAEAKSFQSLRRGPP
jgi:hypothetical protein